MISAQNIHAVEALDVLGLRGQDVAHMGHAGIIDQHIQARQASEGRPDGLGIRHVDGEDHSFAPGFADKPQRLLARFAGDFHHHHVGTIGCETERGGASDTGTGAGHRGNLTFEFLVHVSLYDTRALAEKIFACSSAERPPGHGNDHTRNRIGQFSTRENAASRADQFGTPHEPVVV